MPCARACDYGGGLGRLPVVARASGHGEPSHRCADLALSDHRLLVGPMTATSGMPTPGGFRAHVDHVQ
jgi:hypothetical protein